METLRRFLLVGVMVCVYNGSMVQIIIGTVLAAIFLLVQVQAQPFLSSFDNQLALSSSFCLVIIFVCSYAFKNAALVDLEVIQDKMSREQQGMYVFNTAILSAILIGALFGTLIFSALIFVILLRRERVRHRNE